MLGCVADDYTGGADVASALRRAGLATVLVFGDPSGVGHPVGGDAVVVALKTRTAPREEAVARTVAAVEWLRAAGAGQLYVKYCSTFDSTDEGNIGPACDAVLDQAGASLTLVCPASPEHQRTMYQGHLFVGDRLLSESSLRDHPLTPMTDPDIVRVLGRQTPRTVGLLAHDRVRSGSRAVAARLEELRAEGVSYAVTDVIADDDLDVLARACCDLPVLTGGAGLAGALARRLGRQAGDAGADDRVALPEGPALVLAGSCSEATLAQLEHAEARLPSFRLDPIATPDADRLATEAVRWARDRMRSGPVVVYSSAPAGERAQAAAAVGPDLGGMLERALAEVARSLVAAGVRRVVVAGGETSGAVVEALGIGKVLVAGEEDRGVPWCVTTGQEPLALLLKSGNFGAPDLLARAATATHA